MGVRAAAAAAVVVCGIVAYSLVRSPTPRELEGIVNTYCVSCHTYAESPGGVSFEGLGIEKPQEHPKEWEAAIRKLRLGAMPPPGEPGPGRGASAALVRYLETSLDKAYAANPRLGRTVMHRLNRAEYGNAVRELLDLKVDVANFLPADSASFGFDNNSDTLKVSPLLLSRYLSAAEKISAVAVGDADIGEEALIFSVPNERSQDQHVDGMPLGTQGGTIIDHNFPLDGDYEFKAELWATYAGGARGLEGHDKPYYFIITLDGTEIHRAPIGGKQGNDLGYMTAGGAIRDARDRMQAKVTVKAGPHRVGFGFLATPGGTARTQENISPPERASIGVFEPYGAPKIQHVFIGGPFNAVGPGDTPSRRRIFKCRPTEPSQEPACARTILTQLALKAFGRAPTESEAQELMKFYAQGAAVGGFEKGIQFALPRILAGPEFVFRGEPDRADVAIGVPYWVSDRELANRLALFLWSSIPDDELLGLAAAGKLADPAVLNGQVDRMLADARADSIIENFAGQWLHLRNLDGATPDVIDFSEWDDNLRQAFRRETELFIENIVREDRSVLDLINGDYTFVNERLAKYYGIPSIYGQRFRKVKIEDVNRRGLLGQGSILTVTSVSNRTSPVNRGKWILAELLNSPPPPPPPGVDTNIAQDEGAAPQTMREIMERHRANPQCASCHRLMDPLGLALENFDGIGKWRDTDGGAPIIPATTLFNGAVVSGPAGLREEIMAHSDVVADTITRKLMTFALGRGVEAIDGPAVRKIVRDAEPSGYSFSSIVKGIVTSVPFRMRARVPVSQDGISANNVAANPSVTP
jgi:hypothetical protein